MNQHPPAASEALVQNGRKPAMDDEKSPTSKSQTSAERSALSQNFKALEDQVIHTVHTAKAAIGGTAASVKHAAAATGNAIKSKVASARQTLSLTRQAQRHPWAIVGGAVAAGYLLHRLLTSRTRTEDSPLGRAPSLAKSPEPVDDVQLPGSMLAEASKPAESPAESNGSPNKSAGLSSLFGPHLKPMQDMAVGVLMSVCRDAVTKPLAAEWREPLADAIDKITRQLGGTPIGRPAAPAKQRAPSNNVNPTNCGN
jgi:hypothetical protein